MPIWLHITATVIVFFGGFIVMFFFTPLLSVWQALLALVNGTVPESWWVVRSIAGLAIVVGALVLCNLPCYFFMKWVPARCPREGCGGAARVSGSSPLAYKCPMCGGTYTTHVGIGRR